jgi:hypothetical protein
LYFKTGVVVASYGDGPAARNQGIEFCDKAWPPGF